MEGSNITKVLMDTFDDSIVAKKLLEGPGGRMLKKAADKEIETTIKNLCYKIDLSHSPSVIRLIERIRLLKYEWPAALKRFIEDGEFAFDELEENNLLRQPESETGGGVNP